MNVLAINTASGIYSIALKCKNEIFEDSNTDLAKDTSKILASSIQNLLLKQKIKFEELTAVIVNIGSGSFAGIRVGIASALGFKVVLKNTQFFGITSTQILSLFGNNKNVTVIQDAKRGEYFVQTFNKNLTANSEILLTNKIQLDANNYYITDSLPLSKQQNITYKTFSAKDIIEYYNLFPNNLTKDLSPLYVRDDYTKK